MKRVKCVYCLFFSLRVFEALSYSCARTDILVWFVPDLRHHIHPVNHSCLVFWTSVSSILASNRPVFPTPLFPTKRSLGYRIEWPYYRILILKLAALRPRRSREG